MLNNSFWVHFALAHGLVLKRLGRFSALVIDSTDALWTGAKGIQYSAAYDSPQGRLVITENGVLVAEVTRAELLKYGCWHNDVLVLYFATVRDARAWLAARNGRTTALAKVCGLSRAYLGNPHRWSEKKTLVPIREHVGTLVLIERQYDDVIEAVRGFCALGYGQQGMLADAAGVSRHKINNACRPTAINQRIDLDFARACVKALAQLGRDVKGLHKFPKEQNHD